MRHGYCGGKLRIYPNEVPRERAEAKLVRGGMADCELREIAVSQESVSRPGHFYEVIRWGVFRGDQMVAYIVPHGATYKVQFRWPQAGRWVYDWRLL